MRILNILFISLCWLNPFVLLSSPFAISFPEKQDLTNEDYIEVQKQIRNINIIPTVEALYKSLPPFLKYTTFEDFLGRCSKGLVQVLIDPEKGYLPEKKLVKIGEGGDRCIVTCGPYNGKYPSYVNSIVMGLKEQGFNGYFYYLIGGWPNPTGKEIKYVGVPYSFKIFTMLEAQKLGFNNILWIDSACYPIRDLTPLFDHIEQKGALLNSFLVPTDAWQYIFPQTAEVLRQLTGTNVLFWTYYVNTIAFGLKMDTQEAREIVETYYKLADLGTPFLSTYPEEWVLTAILGQPKFSHWHRNHINNLIVGSLTNSDDSLEEFEKGKQRGGYFYQRKGR